MTNNLSIEQRILCSQLENYSPDVKTAYLGSIHALNAEDHEDRLVHFAHSLREVVDLLTRKNQTDDEKRKPLRKEDRVSQLASVIDPAGKQVYEFYSLYKKLMQEYDELSDFAHHRFKLEQENAEKKLGTVEGILSRLTKPQPEILDEIDGVISTKPSKENALKLKSYLFRWSSHSYLLEKLSCEWLQSLDDAGFFDNPQPMPSSKQKTGVFPYWMPAGYLSKCASSMPDVVTKIILKCKFKNSSERNPAIYDDFLKCSLELAVHDMEKIAQKAIDEKWHDFADNYFIAEKYADLAERLYLEGKYDIALKMLSNLLDSAKIGATHPYRNYEIERILNEKTPKLAEKNPLSIARLLANVTEELARQNMESKSYDSSYTLLNSIEDHEQNKYLMHNVSAICLVSLRDCLVHLGNTNPEELKSNINILSNKKFYIFRKIELFLYDKFPDLFKSEIANALIDFFDVYQVHHEYYNLSKNMFGKIDEIIQKKILDLIKTKSKEIFGKYQEKDSEHAGVRRDAWMLRKLESIHSYLEGEDKGQYEKLIQKLGTPPHPDFDRYMEISIGKSASEPDFFSGKTIDEVFDIIKKHKPTLHTMPYEDKTIASFGDYVRDNPLECSKRSTEIEGLDSKIQYTFLSSIEDAVNTKKKIDWGSTITLIEKYVKSASPDPYSISMFDPMLESCRIIEKGLKENQIDFEFKDRIWDLIQKFIEFSNKKDDIEETEYPNVNSDSLTISINNLEGLSFHTLFRYIWWCHDHKKSKDVFTDNIKKILEDYVKSGYHTISRHSAVGLYVPTMLYFDPEWADKTVLSKIFSSKSNKIAFWDSFVSVNQPQKNTMMHLHVLYNEFLNGAITNNLHEKNFYHSTIEHATLGYLYDITHFDKIFDDFISKADPASIDNCGFFITRILSNNPDVPKFKDKIISLWKNPRFIDHANLDMWFIRKPFDKKENIQLFLNYMQHHSGKFMPVYFPLEELGEYIDDFPRDVAECIQIFVDNLESTYLPKILKPMLEKLLSKKIPEVDDICKKIISNLVTLGYNDYKDLL